MKVDDNILKNLLYTWQSPDVDKFARAKFVADFLKDNEISHRDFCAKYNVPKSTLEGWLVWRKITPLQHQQLIKTGISETYIHNSLKSTTMSGSQVVNHIAETKEDFSGIIEKCIRLLKPYSIHPPDNTNGDLLRVVELRDIVIQIAKSMNGR